jgi:mRNA-degrading endonuclease toxin of MazEF toxin-antitoxin module
VDRITRGRVIWLDVTDPRGIPVGDHAAVILTTKAESESGELLKAVVISSKLQHAAKERMVELPWSRGGHPRTGLSKRSAAMCDWIVTVNEDHIRKYGGLVSGKLLDQIVALINPPTESEQAGS